MIGATHPVLASAGSDWNLSRSLSPLVPVVAESPSPFHRHQRFPLWKPGTHLPPRCFGCFTPRDQPQKTIQYPATGSGSVQ
jgi:hypothetical protein